MTQVLISFASIEITLANLLGFFGFIILAPIAGCLLAGFDRKITARMQGRVGPPILQPYYDVRKLLSKEDASCNTVQTFYVGMYLLFIIIAGAFFFAGANILLPMFVLTLASSFFIIAAYSTRSPYSEVGASREMLQDMACEPMILLYAIVFYLFMGDFGVYSATSLSIPLIAYMPFIFIGFVYVLIIKLRKSPFDLSMSHHAHQELVKGITTEMSGKTLAFVEISHWYENITFIGLLFLLFVWSNPICILIGVVACAIIYLFIIWIDNNFARMKWQFTIKSAWIVAGIFGTLNILFYYAIFAYGLFGSVLN